MKQTIIVTLLCVLALFALSACAVEESTTDVALEDMPVDESELNTESSDVQRVESVSQVVIEEMAFAPTDITVRVGDTVEFVNKDSMPHTVSFEDGRLDAELPAGAVVSYTFTAEDLGEGRYFCKFHPGMRGSVLVVK